LKLRKFTDTGHAKYVLLYNKIKESVIKNNGDIKKGYTKVLKDEIEDLKNDISYSKEVLSGKNLKIQNFKNSYELGVYLNNLLSDCNQIEINFDEKMWDWITLFHFDLVFSSSMSGISEHRYILSDDWFIRYRHLIRTPWYAVNTYGNASKLFLSKAAYIGSDYLEQYISHRISENYTPSAVIAYELYYDKEMHKPRPGYSKKFIRKKGIKTLVKASLGRLIDKINQYNQIYNIWLMEPKDIISLLPKEFDDLKKLNGHK
jgi:hypothetical protein